MNMSFAFFLLAFLSFARCFLITSLCLSKRKEKNLGIDPSNTLIIVSLLPKLSSMPESWDPFFFSLLCQTPPCTWSVLKSLQHGSQSLSRTFNYSLDTIFSLHHLSPKSSLLADLQSCFPHHHIILLDCLLRCLLWAIWRSCNKFIICFLGGVHSTNHVFPPILLSYCHGP